MNKIQNCDYIFLNESYWVLPTCGAIYCLYFSTLFQIKVCCLLLQGISLDLLFNSCLFTYELLHFRHTRNLSKFLHDNDLFKFWITSQRFICCFVLSRSDWPARPISCQEVFNYSYELNLHFAGYSSRADEIQTNFYETYTLTFAGCSLKRQSQSLLQLEFPIVRISHGVWKQIWSFQNRLGRLHGLAAFIKAYFNTNSANHLR